MKTLLAGEYLKDSPPLYEEIFPEVKEGTCKQSGEVSRLLELREEDSRTYFTREKECVEGRGEYRGELDWKDFKISKTKPITKEPSLVFLISYGILSNSGLRPRPRV